jgi:hypothetical protein
MILSRVRIRILQFLFYNSCQFVKFVAKKTMTFAYFDFLGKKRV